MGSAIKRIINRFANYLLKSSKWRARLYRLTQMSLQYDAKLKSKNWRILDPIYAYSHRQLRDISSWRYGTVHVYDSARWAFDHIEKYAQLRDSNYCDLGCGKHHPYGTSTVLYLNGAARCIATDILSVENTQRSAEALYELLLDCLASPDKWLWTDISKDQYLQRIYQFDLDALKNGNLQLGVKNVPIKHIISNINHPSSELKEIDIMSSRAVLEHFLEFEIALKNLYDCMNPGGIAYHFIDLVDHGVYSPSSKSHFWSFLEVDEWNGHTNRLRAHEIHDIILSVGFDILEFKAEMAPLPNNLREKLKGKFREMTNEQLEIIRVGCTIKKPN